MLIKLIIVDSNHFIRFKCKIIHCLDIVYTLSLSIYQQLFLMIMKNLVSEELGILIGVGTFTSRRSFDTQSLQLVTINKLKKSMPGGLQLFPFYF